MAHQAAKRSVATVAAAGALAAVTALVCTAPAGADPEVPVDPALPVVPPAPGPPPPSSIGTTLAQNGVPGGPAGMPAVVTSQDQLLLGQNVIPSLPGGLPGTPPPLRALNNAYLLPQNLVPSAPGEGTVFGVAPGDEQADITGREYLKRLRAMYHDGGLTGALLGRRQLDELGEPLPGTEPPPGTQMPPGLGENLPDQPPVLLPPAGSPIG